MAAKDTQILIELKDTVPQFTFGKDVTARDITLSRARMVRAYRMFLRGIVKPIDAKKDLEERQLQLAEAKQREADDAERRRIAYEEQRERDNGKTDNSKPQKRMIGTRNCQRILFRRKLNAKPCFLSIQSNL